MMLDVFSGVPEAGLDLDTRVDQLLQRIVGDRHHHVEAVFGPGPGDLDQFGTDAAAADDGGPRACGSERRRMSRTTA